MPLVRKARGGGAKKGVVGEGVRDGSSGAALRGFAGGTERVGSRVLWWNFFSWPNFAACEGLGWQGTFYGKYILAVGFWVIVLAPTRGL